jgi:hypothetical protein
MLETEKAALLDAFRQIDELRRRLDFQYSKLNKLEEDLSPLRLMTDPTPLSPAAQAVLDAVFDHWPGGYNHPGKPRCVAAALRAAAVQVDAVNVPDHIRGDAYWAHRNGRAAAEGHLLRIAAELEGFNV